MSRSWVVKMAPLVIPNGAAVSNILTAKLHYFDAAMITLYAPAVLDAVTYTIEVNPDPEATAATPGWVTLRSDETPTNQDVPAEGTAYVYYDLPAVGAFRIAASGNSAAARTFSASKQVTT